MTASGPGGDGERTATQPGADRLLATEVTATAMRVPLAKPIGSALASYGWVDFTAVHVGTDAGVTGFGYTYGVGGNASAALVPYIGAELAPLLIGEDLFRPEAVWHRLWSPNKARMRAGLGVWALSAVDIACWDALGKAVGQPVHRLLGGYTTEVPVYGSGGWLTLTDTELVDECQAFAAMGIRSYKYKIGGQRDEARTGLLRREMGDDFVLLVDANQSFDVDGAVAVAHTLHAYGVGWLEEPVKADSVGDLARVARRSPVPVAAGENVYKRWGFREVCELRAATYLQPDPGRCGGITEFRRIGALADAFGVRLTTHLLHELSVSLVGSCSSSVGVELVELLPADVFAEPFDVSNGRASIPATPGHGVALAPGAMERYGSSSRAVSA
jgi:L-alanine-DL-glutamate epimerase-like enolase superfamily enzyme